MTTSSVRSTSALTLSYEGPALAENAISVRDLGPALVALGNLFDRPSSLLLFGEKATTDLKVTTTRSGSFEIDLVLQMGFVASNLLTSPLVVSALNLRQVTAMAIGLCKRLREPDDERNGQSDREAAEAIEHVAVRLGDFELIVDGSPDMSGKSCKRSPTDRKGPASPTRDTKSG